MRMAEYTKDDALGFVESMRLTIGTRTGFRWLAARLTDLAAFIESTTAENERLNAYLDEAGVRDDYEAFAAAHAHAVAEEPVPES